ncbi:hypothetical protein CLPU_21c00350 [Gottschalkia purinilytica]|uniref:DUF4097 domain-containing protein n=1 Tax=Gottschalkia purinilytica TaxID=1503 RepID=A0A0L0W6X0_GOTPU|nr:DUF4097 family beta strand repeat-containing protein [Gottschalkia purinilytica]KNF07217.1 hypothetical protein CLPU_21c00350 [Gottschalkia purinilytica]
MKLKTIFIICIVVGIGSILASGVLYFLGGNEILKVRNNDKSINKTVIKEEFIDNIQTIKIKSSVSDIYLEYTDTDKLKLELINPLKRSKEPLIIKNDGKKLNIDVNKIYIGMGNNNINVYSTLNVYIPKKYKENIDIRSDVGKLNGEYSGKNLDLRVDVGNIDLEINEIKYGKISTDVGNINVKIKEENDITFDLETDVGKIENMLKNIKINSKENSLPGISQSLNFDVNKGGNLIKLRSNLGSIKVYD